VIYKYESDLFSYLGTSYGGDVHLCYVTLKEQGITTIIEERDFNSSDIYVLTSQKEQSQKILDSAGIELEILYYRSSFYSMGENDTGSFPLIL
jgi:hypothetical protein